MRKGLVYAGVGILVIGVAVAVLGILGLGQASAAFLNCTNGFPTDPMFGFPAACTNAMGAMVAYQGLEWLGGVLGLLGLVLLVVGLVLQPEGPAAMTYYPPPVYGPPPGIMPPQAPPPPQP